MSDWSAVDDVWISSPPNCVYTPLGAMTGCAMEPSSTTPYTANASVVAGV